jgi:hypothetical protein
VITRGNGVLNTVFKPRWLKIVSKILRAKHFSPLMPFFLTYFSTNFLFLSSWVTTESSYKTSRIEKIVKAAFFLPRHWLVKPDDLHRAQQTRREQRGIRTIKGHCSECCLLRTRLSISYQSVDPKIDHTNLKLIFS